jgi:hypothetical protein
MRCNVTLLQRLQIGCMIANMIVGLIFTHDIAVVRGRSAHQRVKAVRRVP